MSDAPFDSRPDTMEHIGKVAAYLDDAAERLKQRACDHDKSKLQSPEKEAFDELGEGLRGLTYGSDEYRARLRQIKPAIQHHYSLNTHHPEFHAMNYDPIDGSVVGADEAALESGEAIGRMSLLDLLEMLCDWKAASERHDNGDIVKSVEHNTKRFGLSPQIAQILLSTIREMGWVPT